MENNNNGRGIFYGVIGVATLIVAIIGATFAYFSAQANSDVNAVTAAGAKVGLEFTDVKTGLKTDLIPVNEGLSGFLTKPGVSETDCKDNVGNNICSTYTFTVTNPSTNTASQRIYVTLTPSVNTFGTLYYAIYKGTAAQVIGTDHDFNVMGTPVTEVSNSTKNTIGVNGDLVRKGALLSGTTAIELTEMEQVLDVNESVTYTIVLWIHETNGDQNASDSGKSFAGGINVTTVKGTTGVTGVLAA